MRRSRLHARARPLTLSPPLRRPFPADHPQPPDLPWQAIYVAFVLNISSSYRAAPKFFLAYGPMTLQYEPIVKNVSLTLSALGVSATTLDLSLAHPMTGCFGHPSLADNIEIAAKAKPQIAAFMGWT